MDTKNIGLIGVVDRGGIAGYTEVWWMVRQRRDTGEQNGKNKQGDGRATEWEMQISCVKVLI